MSAVSHWMHVDLFTVEQAAALWAGFDPARVSSVDVYKPSEVIAARQMLIAAIAGNKLPADTSSNVFVNIGNHNASLVSRADLEVFARTLNLFPAFLFDTLAPFEASGQLLQSQETPRIRTVDPPPAVRPTGRGGRPQEHDRDSFVLEIISRANQPDGLPETQAELVRSMLDWFQQKYGREPAESSVKDRISKIYRYLQAAKNLDT